MATRIDFNKHKHWQDNEIIGLLQFDRKRKIVALFFIKPKEEKRISSYKMLSIGVHSSLMQ